LGDQKGRSLGNQRLKVGSLLGVDSRVGVGILERAPLKVLGSRSLSPLE